MTTSDATPDVAEAEARMRHWIEEVLVDVPDDLRELEIETGVYQIIPITYTIPGDRQALFGRVMNKMIDDGHLFRRINGRVGITSAGRAHLLRTRRAVSASIA